MKRFLIAALTACFWCSSAYAQDAGRSGPASASDVAGMPPGSWLPIGRPWRDVDPGRGDNCGVDFGSLLGAWNGVVWDGRYVWIWAAGGHGDGCFNGIVRYDLDAGKPEMVVPHLALNVPFCRGPFTKANGQEDCYYEPYVSDRPHPGGMRERVIAPAEPPGNFLRPRSSHMYNNMVRIGDFIYLLTGQIFGSGRGDAQVWRFNVADPANTIERLPDRWDPNARAGQGDTIGDFIVNWVMRPDQPPVMISGATACEPDLVTGQYNCAPQQFSFSTGATTAWDEQRQGFWAVDGIRKRLSFVRQVDGVWTTDPALSVTDDIMLGGIGRAGICVVPTEGGGNPVIWGESNRLIRWDGDSLHAIDLPGGPAAARRRILSKWTWNGDLGVCLGTWTVNEGFWAYKPAFSREKSYPAAANQSEDPAGAQGTRTITEELSPLHSPAKLPPAPTPNPSLENNPLLLGTPLSRLKQESSPAASQENTSEDQQTSLQEPGVNQRDEVTNLKERRWTDRADYPVFAGHHVAPAAFTPAPWDEPIERLPEAPGYEALCPGGWAEMHITEPYDSRDLAAQMRGLARSGTPNVRVYLHPLPDGGAYGGMKFDEVTCSELVGVPEDGERPLMVGGVAPGRMGLIARGIDFEGESVGWWGNAAVNEYIRFIVLHDLRVSNVDNFWGVARPEAPHTYLELVGNRFTDLTNGHLIYLERSIGHLVAVGNVFAGSGTGKHALKNLAHRSRIEGNVFSNVGIDGQPLAISNRGDGIVGLAPLDLYLCTETIFRNNTVLFRTANITRAFLLYRGRNAWGNCDKGRRQSDGRWEMWAPESPEYDDPAKWALIQDELSDFALGFQAAFDNPWLFAHLNEGNTFIAFNAEKRDGVPVDDTRAAEVHSLRPLADNAVEAVIQAESNALSQKCAGDTACYEAGMSAALRYAYERYSSASQATMVKTGDMPNNVPIRAPAEWRERAGLFWGDQTFITCSGDGRDCQVTGRARAVSAEPNPYDDIQVAHPPRVIMLE